MPVWQGQGRDSGIRDAANLGWKLAAVVTGKAEDALLDTYDVQRHKHARAMIDLDGRAGHLADQPTVAALRDRQLPSPSLVPTLKRYILEMRFKPMARAGCGLPLRQARGADRHRREPSWLVSTPATATASSTMCSAPASPCCAGATTRARCSAKETRPVEGVGGQVRSGAPDQPQLHLDRAWLPTSPSSLVEPRRYPEGLVDAPHRTWCWSHPDRHRRGCGPSHLNVKVLYLTQGGGTDAADTVLYVPQSTSESSGTVRRTSLMTSTPPSPRPRGRDRLRP